MFRRLFSILSFTSLLLASCTVHKGQLLDLDYSGSSSETEKAYGYAKATYFFNIGGNSTNGLILEAKENLFQNRTLNGDEEFVNISISNSATIFYPWLKNTIIISADVKNASNTANTNSPFSIGDKLYNLSMQEIGSYAGTYGQSKILVKKKHHRIKFKLFKKNECFRTTGSFKGVSIGDKVSAYDNFEQDYVNAEIVGIGIDYFLIKSGKNDRLRIVQIDSIKK